PARPGGTFTARGRLVHATRGLGLSEVFIQDQDGRLLAHGSSLCFIRPAIKPDPAANDAPDPGARDEDVSEVADADHAGPDPHEQPAAGGGVAQEGWAPSGGLWW